MPLSAQIVPTTAPSTATPQKLLRPLLVISLVALAGCGGGGDGIDPTPAAVASSPAAAFEGVPPRPEDRDRGTAASGGSAASPAPAPSAPQPPAPAPASTPGPAPVPTPSPAPLPAPPVSSPSPVAAPIATRDVPPVATAARSGAWSPIVSWPIVAIHSSVLPDGRVMTYGTDKNGKQTAKFFYDVWNPFEGTSGSSHLTLENQTGTDIFCSAQLVLPESGDLLINGGDIFDTVRNGTTNQPTSAQPTSDGT